MSDYLHDKTGEPDRELAEIERLLGRFAHDQRPWSESLRAPQDRRLRRWLAAAAAIVVMAGGGGYWLNRSNPKPIEGMVVRAGERVLSSDEWFTANTSETRLDLENPDGQVGNLELQPGSRLQIKRVANNETLLFLQKGKLNAFISPDVKPRFFQVDTPSAKCVDLGCQYDLSVDEHGDAHVSVSLGQIAFELGEREVYVPSGAECFAAVGRGLGTPRFADCGAELKLAIDSFDATTNSKIGLARRHELAGQVADLIHRSKDSLMLYHLLQDHDPAVQSVAELRLIDLVGAPREAENVKKGAPGIDLASWREHLRDYWW